MKKPFIAFSIACACATGAFADHGDNEQWQTPWFNAIGAETTTTIVPTNGTWELGAGATVENKKLVLDQEEGVSSSFTIGDAYTVDSGTIVEVKAKAKFYPVLSTDLTTPSNAKVAFAVVKTGTTLSYQAWVTGSAWTELQGLGTPTTSDEVEVLIRMNYRNANTTSDTDARQVSFFVGGTQSSTHIALPNDLTANPTGFSIAGCGTVASVDGEVQYNVAKIGDVGYATVTNAMAAAEDGQTVSVVRETDEVVVMPEGKSIKIADNGNVSGGIVVPSGSTLEVQPTQAEMVQSGPAGASGTYVIPCVAGGQGTVNVTLPAEMAVNKEIVPGTVEPTLDGVSVEIRTQDAIVSNALAGIEVKDAYRTFLTTYIGEAYTNASANAADIGTALTASGDNHIAKWQSYVLGITPTTAVAPVTPPAGDTDGSYIILAIPAIDKNKYSGDYGIKYVVNTEESDNPSEIRVPLTTDNYNVKIVLEDPVTPL